MVKYADTERKPGIYRAKFVALDTEYTFTDKATGEDITRWRWVFQDVADGTTVGEMDTITSQGFRTRSNGLKFFTGMLGRTPTEQDDTDTLIGLDFDVVWGPNQAGRNTITNVSKPTLTGGLPTPAPLVEGLPAVDTTSDGDLPF